ncbi:MAG: hypothetical protein ACFFBR_00325 [Promethearchaeota archaeon]
MQATFDLFVLAMLFEAMVYIPLFLTASLALMKFIDILSCRLGTLIRYLAFPGIVLHEICHDLLCRLTGIPILEHRIFLGKHEGVVGGVIVDVDKIQTFTSSILVAFAPFFILAFGLYLLISSWHVLPMHQGLVIYFAFCFFIGLSPSKADVQLVISVAKNRPSQTFLELLLLSLPLIAGCLYLIYNSLTGATFSIILLGALIIGSSVLALILWQLLKPHRNS